MKNIITLGNTSVLISFLFVLQIAYGSVEQNNELAKLKNINDPVVIEKTEKQIKQDKFNALNKEAKELIDKISSIKSLSARFYQTEVAIQSSVKNTVSENVIKGELSLAKPNKVKWQINEPVQEKQVYVTNGKTFWHYDKSLEQVVLDNYNSKRIVNSPFYFLLSDVESIIDKYEITKSGDATYKLTAKGQSKLQTNYITDLELSFDQDSNKLNQISFVSAKSKKVAIKLEQVLVNKRVHSSSFNFRAPRGVDVIKASEIY